MLLTQGAALGAVRDGSCGSRCPPRLPRRQRVLANVRALRQKAHGSSTEGWLDEAQRPRALTTFVSTQMAAAANKKAPPNATSTSPGQFDLMPKPLPRPFRFQRVTPGAKPLGATQSASPPAGLRRTGKSPHVKGAEGTTLLSPNWLFGSQVKMARRSCPGRGTCALGEFIMAQPTEEQIRKRAFELWEQAGKPEGREDDFWNQAQRELQGAEERDDPNKGADI